MKHILLHVLLVLCCLSIVSFVVFPVLAVTVHVDQSPSTIASDQFTVNVLVTGAVPGTNYLRVDLYKDGTTNYFGETFNGQNWYSGSDGTQYFAITIADDKTGNGMLQSRVGNTLPKSYDGSGTYKLKIRRYTSANDYTFSDPVDIVFAFPTLANTPAPTSTPTKTPTPTRIPTPTRTLTPTRTPTPIKTPIPQSYSVASSLTVAPTTIAKEAIDDLQISSSASDSSDVLDVTTKSATTHTSPTGIITQKETLFAGADEASKKNNWWPVIIVCGGIFLLAGGILLFWRYYNNKVKS